MEYKFLFLFSAICVAGCNTISVKPHTLDKTQKIYVDTNGDKIRLEFKDELERRGYNVTVGKKTQVNKVDYAFNEANAAVSTTSTDGARYVATINEYPNTEYMIVLSRFPLCMFNGWSWWDFSLSIADNQTGKEILNWSGMGCKGTVKSDLKRLLDELEK